MPKPERYAYAGGTEVQAGFERRTGARNAAFLLPHLRPGMRLLDAGCGPGTITLDLAEAVKPGEVVGIDMQEIAIARARELATQRSVTNVRFEVADIYRLPFADASFDAAFSHMVLMHLREPVRALAEIRRVLRPGGVVGIVDPDLRSTVRYPSTARWEQFHALRIWVHEYLGTDTFVAPKHRRLLIDAGFARTEASANSEGVGTRERCRERATFLKNQLSGYAPTAIEQGWIDQASVVEIRADIDAWAELPDAFFTTIVCDALGWTADRTRP